MADSKRKTALLNDNPLCGISTYKDILNLATGVCMRKIKKLVLDGTEEWRNYGQVPNTYRLSISNTQSIGNPAICSHFVNSPISEITSGKFTVGSTWIYVRYADVSDLADFKSYLQQQYTNGTPVTVWYILATPTTETITVPSGLSGTEEGYMNQSGTPTPTNPIYPTANNVEVWQHSLRKLTTSTDTLTTLPADIYADGNNATVGISGNTVQNGTPTPDNPIQPSECGERTGNLFDKDSVMVGGIDADGSIAPNDNMRASDYIRVNPNTVYAATYLTIAYYGRTIAYYDTNKNLISTASNIVQSKDGTATYTITTPNNCYYVRIATYVRVTNHVDDIMFNLGTTPLPYEPYGYKIPISSANTTTPVYLGEVETTRKVKKLVLTGKESLINTGGNAPYKLPINDIAISPSTTSIEWYCSHYQSVSSKDSWASYDYCISRTSTTAQSLQFRDVTKGDITAFKQYLQQQYAAGTPVTVWYVLATEKTGIVNEPLMKIGDYADEVSGITIPTTAGTNSFDVLTTLKPSEVTVSYTGWHDAYVKEKSENVTPFASAQTIVNNGVTFVSDGMGRYTVNGTATADASAYFDIPEFTIPVSVGAGGQGTFSLFNDSFGDNDGNVIEFYNNTTLIDVWSLHLDNRTSTTYVDMSGKKCNRIRIVVPSGVSVNHKSVKPMFTNNSTLPSAYEPYWK